MKVIIQLQYSSTDSRVFHDVKNITQSSLQPTQPNPTHGWTQPMTNSETHAIIYNQRVEARRRYRTTVLIRETNFSVLAISQMHIIVCMKA